MYMLYIYFVYVYIYIKLVYIFINLLCIIEILNRYTKHFKDKQRNKAK